MMDPLEAALRLLAPDEQLASAVKSKAAAQTLFPDTGRGLRHPPVRKLYSPAADKGRRPGGGSRGRNPAAQVIFAARILLFLNVYRLWPLLTGCHGSFF
jgi:hypothetical protein